MVRRRRGAVRGSARAVCDGRLSGVLVDVAQCGSLSSLFPGLVASPIQLTVFRSAAVSLRHKRLGGYGFINRPCERYSGRSWALFLLLFGGTLDLFSLLDRHPASRVRAVWPCPLAWVCSPPMILCILFILATEWGGVPSWIARSDRGSKLPVPGSLPGWLRRLVPD